MSLPHGKARRLGGTDGIYQKYIILVVTFQKCCTPSGVTPYLSFYCMSGMIQSTTIIFVFSIHAVGQHQVVNHVL